MGDIHRATAAEVFDLEPVFVTDEQRRRAKAINFGLIYGMSAFGLARQLGIERAEAAAYIDRYFERYPGVRYYMDLDAQWLMKKVTSRRCLAGGLRFLIFAHAKCLFAKLLSGRRLMLRCKGQRRILLNVRCYGFKKALATTNLGCNLLLQVHDELVFEVRDQDLDGARQIIRTEMESAAELAVPLIVEIGVAKVGLRRIKIF